MLFGINNVFVKRVEIKVECNILIKICVNERGTNNAKKLVIVGQIKWLVVV